MAIINYDGISGINSITSVGSGVKFYNTNGSSSFTITPSGTGNASFGQALSISDLSWVKDPYQQVYSFSGTTGGSTSSPADGSLLLGNPNANPSATRVGTIVFGNKVSGTSVTGNPGIKAVIDSITNTNVANAADTGGSLRFYTKPDNGELAVRMTIDSAGRMTTPYQPIFYTYQTAAASGTALGVFTTQFNTTLVNIGSCYSTSTGRFTAPVAGTYKFDGRFLARQQGTNGPLEFTFYKNGTNVVARSCCYTSVSGSGDHDNMFASIYLTLAVNDYVQIGFTVVNGGTDYYYGENLASFSGQLIG